MKYRISAKLLGAMLLFMCLGLLWLLISGHMCRSFGYKVHISNREESPLIAFGLLSVSSSGQPTEASLVPSAPTTPSPVDGKAFDATMLTREEERHVERLARLEAGIAGMRDFLVRHVRASDHDSDGRLAATLVKAREYLRVMEADIAVIKATDQAARNSIESMRKLRNYVRDTIQRLQNPSDCESAPKLHCLLDNPHGLAAGVHDALWCFVAALQMGRTVVLNSTLWHYSPGVDGWLRTFQPVAGPACDGVGRRNTIIKGYPGYDSATRERSKILDLPASIVKTLVANHADPYAWWYGQIVSYIFRLQNSTWQAIDDFKMANGYKHPIVGMHIRRTDKKREAAYHDVREYMQHAEEFYNKLMLKGGTVQRRIFVATDDPAVIVEIRSKFPGYAVISNQHSAREAFNMKSRKQSSTLIGMLIDIFLLAESDQLVCGFSSGFCRVAYELMQARDAEAGADATRKAVSVDVEYFYAYVPFPAQRTIYRNKRVFENELEWPAPGILLERSGDFASLHEARDKKYADGFNTGRIVGSLVDGNRMVFPRFKAMQTYSVAKYAAFNNSQQ